MAETPGCRPAATSATPPPIPSRCRRWCDPGSRSTTARSTCGPPRSDRLPAGKPEDQILDQVGNRYESDDPDQYEAHEQQDPQVRCAAPLRRRIDPMWQVRRATRRLVLVRAFAELAHEPSGRARWRPPRRVAAADARRD